MRAISLPPALGRRASPAQPDAGVAFVTYLRQVALRCRVKPRADLFRACAMLKADPQASRDAHAEALIRCLDQALGARAKLLAPGAKERSFDERWLLQLGLATLQRDSDSQRFLLASRVARENRRLVGFLIGRVAADFLPI